MKHELKHIVSAQELMTSLAEEAKHRPPQMGINDLKVRISTGPGKHQTFLISSIYYSPESQSLWIDVEQ